MLHEFLSDNRAELIERCGLKVAQRPSPKPTSVELEFGIPLFLDQLVKTLRMERTSEPMRSREISGPSGGRREVPSEIGSAAARHGVELLKHGFTVDQVVKSTGFELVVPGTVTETEPPTPDELHVLRTRIDVRGALRN